MMKNERKNRKCTSKFFPKDLITQTLSYIWKCRNTTKQIMHLQNKTEPT